ARTRSDHRLRRRQPSGPLPEGWIGLRTRRFDNSSIAPNREMARCQTRSPEPSSLTPLFYQGEFLILSGRKLSRVGQVFQNSPPSNTSIRNSCRRSFYLLETYHSKAAQLRMLCGQSYRKLSFSTMPSAAGSFFSG